MPSSVLAAMKPEEMASNELKKIREKFTKEAINDHQMAQNEGNSHKSRDQLVQSSSYYNLT